MDRPSGPCVNEQALVTEIKSYIYEHKMDAIDYKIRVVQFWPDPSDGVYPETGKFASQFSKVFSYADNVTGENGENFPEDLVKEYEAVLASVEGKVNSDDAFWIQIRSEVMPLYDRLKDNPRSTPQDKKLHKEWTTKRWRSIRLFYDPVGMEVRTTKKMRGESSNKVYSEEVISDRVIPEGLVIDLDGIGLSSIQRS